jgi:RNA polymerase sigma-70 factor (ECF subfamily)
MRSTPDAPSHSEAAVGPAAAGCAVAQLDEPALFRAAQSGNFAACEQIVLARRDSIYRLVDGLLGNPADTEEVVQEVFLSLFRNLHQFAFESSPRTWVTRIAIHAALMRLRSQRRKPLLALDDYRSGSASPDEAALWQPSPWHDLPDRAVLSRELTAAIHRAMHRLPEKYRLVLQLRDVEDLTAEEVAQTLGLTVPTVKSRLHRARLAVRHALEGYFASQG